jgi:2-polyprenyl-3-methyl-5-hydroxy-6-metoxy-1,4-benzoquinol methylase
MKYNQEDIRKVQEYYDAFLASEPGKYSSLEEFKSRFEPVLSYLKGINSHPTKILDVGCGTGMASEMLKRFGVVYGIDISQKSIEEARKYNRCDKCYVCIAEELPFEDGMFNVVVCTEVMEHLLDPSKALSEMNRVLNIGGNLIISTPNPWYYQLFIRMGKGKIRRRKLGQIIENPISPLKLKKNRRKSGFTVDDFKTVYFKPDYIWAFIKRLSNSFGSYQINLTKNVKEVSV